MKAFLILLLLLLLAGCSKVKEDPHISSDTLFCSSSECFSLDSLRFDIKVLEDSVDNLNASRTTTTNESIRQMIDEAVYKTLRSYIATTTPNDTDS